MRLRITLAALAAISATVLLTPPSATARQYCQERCYDMQSCMMEQGYVCTGPMPFQPCYNEACE